MVLIEILFILWRYPNLKNVRELIYKKGFAKIEGQKVPLTDNNIIEQVWDILLNSLTLLGGVLEYSALFFLVWQALGKHGIMCIEDIVHEIANVGPHFKEVTSFLWPFTLNKPEGGFQGKKKLFKEGGDAGNRGDKINELIGKMN